MEQNATHDTLRQDAWNNALHSYGYGYIYGLRGENLNKKLKLITFLGIIIPVLIGGIVTTYGINSPVLIYLMMITAPLSLVQLFLSVWAVSYNWNSAHAYYQETALDNYSLATQYEQIGKYPPVSIDDLRTVSEKVKVLRDNRDRQDNKYPINENEKRQGMRYALRQFKRSCAGCKIIPIDMANSKCGVCGNF